MEARREPCTRVTMMWNAFRNQYAGKHTGLRTYLDPLFRQRLLPLLANPTPPDFVIWNSNLHDQAMGGINQALHKQNLLAALNWLAHAQRPEAKTRFVWRTAKTPAGWKRFHKPAEGVMQTERLLTAASSVMLGERGRQRVPRRLLGLVDAYDVTYPMHWDNNFADGHHYGLKGPRKVVELMLVQLYLHALCPPI
eukprot:TRINITY_DN12822_c0_g1_i1.p1 TRINITY_DN12822_c0_g1~~TRINITY_DN12822_c0_g1_i1.p1  ORF type:complete len:195 (+),score=13.32 TRINITY_DN12822_c0_g1_i1:395-979(+)